MEIVQYPKDTSNPAERESGIFDRNTELRARRDHIPINNFRIALYRKIEKVESELSDFSLWLRIIYSYYLGT